MVVKQASHKALNPFFLVFILEWSLPLLSRRRRRIWLVFGICIKKACYIMTLQGGAKKAELIRHLVRADLQWSSLWPVREYPRPWLQRCGRNHSWEQHENRGSKSPLITHRPYFSPHSIRSNMKSYLHPISPVKSQQINVNLQQSQVSPQLMSMSLLPGDSREIDVEVFAPLKGPLDLYILMDFSNSMADDLNNLKNMGTELGELLCFIIILLLYYFTYSEACWISCVSANSDGEFCFL